MAEEATGKKPNTLILKIILAVIAIAVIGGVYFAGMHHEKKVETPKMLVNGTFLEEGTPVTPFTLTGTDGQPFTQDDLKGHWSIVVFGYTNCGYVCPTTMANLNKVYTHLQQDLPNQILPEVVLISVDPDRDTLDRMKNFVTSFNPNFIGLRGDAEQTAAAQKALHAELAKIVSDDAAPAAAPADQATPAPAAPANGDQNATAPKAPAADAAKTNSNYAINYSTDLVLVDGNGNIRAYFPYPQNSDDLAQDYKTIINHVEATWLKPQTDAAPAKADDAAAAKPASDAPADKK